ncbi:MAG: hypothetical protein M0R80_03180 [Proteobacteria bacterium]|jgi:hypothetical protein|nr:hypothetical protein [Pseudomonadota bacterium]
MTYRIQTNHNFHGENISERDWNTISSSRAGHQEFDDDELAIAIKTFERNANMARMIWPMRLIDSNGQILRYYNPELDEWLPGPRGRLEEKAYYIWEKIGATDVECWFKAKEETEKETSNLSQFFGHMPKFSERGLLEPN